MAHIPKFKLEAHKDLIQAVEASSIPDINKAVARGADVNATDSEGRLPLSIAASSGNLEVLNRLLHLAADASARGADEHTALWAAAEAGHEAIIKRLLLWDSSAQAEELAAAATHAALSDKLPVCALLLKKLSQVDESRCVAVLQQLQDDVELSQRLDQAIMQAWVADVNGQAQQPASLQEHQKLVDAQRQGVEQLLFRVAEMVREQQPKHQRGP